MTETVTRQLTYEELAANYQALLTSNQELLTSNQELLSENAYLKSELAQLKRLIFGQKRERFIPVANSQQLEIALAQDRPPAPPVVTTTTITYTRRKTKARPIKLPSRNALPCHLRREEIIIAPTEDTSTLKKIGEEITEELEYQPGELYVKRYVRPKYVRPESDASTDSPIIVAPLPRRAIDDGDARRGAAAVCEAT